MSANRPPPSASFEVERQFTGRLSQGFVPFSVTRPGRAERYGEYRPIPLRRYAHVRPRTGDGRTCTPPLRFCACGKTRCIVSTAHVCDRYRGLRGGTAVICASIRRRHRSCAAGSLKRQRSATCLRPSHGLVRPIFSRRTTLVGFQPFAVFILPAGVGMFPSVFPTCRFASRLHLEGFLSRGRPSRAVFTHA